MHATAPVAETSRAQAKSGRKRVLIIGPLPPPYHGGAVVTRTLLTSTLVDRFELVHFDITDRRGLDNIGRLDFGNVWLAAAHGVRFLALLARSRFDAVYVPVSQNTLGFLRDALFLAPVAAARIPLVLHFHSGRFAEFVQAASPPVRVLVRSLLGRAHCAIVLGNRLRGMLEGLVPADRIVVVPNAVADESGVAARRAATTRSERTSAPRGPLRVLFLGNLIEGKGYAELIDAVAMLVREGRAVELVLAGGGLVGREQQRLQQGSGIASRLRFAGPVAGPEKQALLQDADVLALPSYYVNEAHPLVLLEAMAAGLPVVSTHHVAIPEIVVDGETGILVEPRNVPALAAALRRLADDPQLRDRMGRAARVRYEAHFTVDRWVERMSAVFDTVTPGTGR